MTEVERSEHLRRVAAGDGEALARLLTEYHRPLLRVVECALSAGLRRRVEAEDILQEAYVAAFRAVAERDGRGAAPAEAGAGDRMTPGAQTPSADSGAANVDGPAAVAFETPGAFYAWLERIVRNELRDAERAARSLKRDVGREARAAPRADFGTSCTDLVAQVSGSGTSPSGALRRDEAAAAVLVALARLPAEQRAIIRLRYFENVPVGEIAARLGKTEAAVYAAYGRGLKGLGGVLTALARGNA